RENRSPRRTILGDARLRVHLPDHAGADLESCADRGRSGAEYDDRSCDAAVSWRAVCVPTRRISFDTVRKIGLALPDVEEGTAYGSPALKVRGQMFACLAAHKSAEPGSLVIRIDFDQRDELIAADPQTYYLTDHYVDYPAMLIRLSRVNRDALRDLLIMAHRFVSARSNRPARRAKRRGTV